jgi:phage anti-repressor protein
MDLTLEVVSGLVRSTDAFPIDFDDAWQWIGYSEKRAALKVLDNNFIEGIDFLYKGTKSSSGGRPSEWIVLTIDCFKSLAMMAGTPKGREVRRYFLRCEAELDRRREAERKYAEENYAKKLHAATLKVYVLDDPANKKVRGRIFQESFYREIYRLKGYEFTPGKTQHPMWMSQITIDLVYRRLQPGVWDELIKKNPRVRGKRKHCCHQFLSDNIGNLHLKNHLYAVTNTMSGCNSWEQFMAYADKFHPRCSSIQMNILFDLLAQTPEEFEYWNGLVS